MAETPSTMTPLGSKLPAFSLPDTVSGAVVSREQFRNVKALVVMFICNHCPFVKHVNAEIAKLAGEYQPRGVAFVAISSNDVGNYPDDAPEKMKEVAEQEGYSFPYLYDETQEVARAFDAACTPDFFVYNGEHALAYRGQLDDSRPGNEQPVNGKDLRGALDALLSGEQPSDEQKPSVGCNIKWK